MAQIKKQGKNEHLNCTSGKLKEVLVLGFMSTE